MGITFAPQKQSSNPLLVRGVFLSGRLVATKRVANKGPDLLAKHNPLWCPGVQGTPGQCGGWVGAFVCFLILGVLV